jgi:hypothetical protein
MNKKIEELIHEAEGVVLDKVNSFDEDNFEYTYDDTFEETFAKLIIMECTKLIRQGSFRKRALYEDEILRPDEIAGMIEHYFGIE